MPGGGEWTQLSGVLSEDSVKGVVSGSPKDPSPGGGLWRVGDRGPDHVATGRKKVFKQGRRGVRGLEVPS